MKRIFISFTILIMICAFCACSQKAPTWQEQYDLGVRYLSEGNYEEAIIAFTAAIEIDPKRAPAYVGHGDAHFGIAQQLLSNELEQIQLQDKIVSSYENAIADYLAALDLDDSLIEIYQKAAEVYIALGDLDSAIALVERGITATGDESLQVFLEQLQKESSLTVLAHQAYYQPSGALEYEEYFFYDNQGYIIRHESLASGKTEIETYVYNKEYTSCQYIPDQQNYDTESEWQAAIEDLTYFVPGSPIYYTGGYQTINSVCLASAFLPKDELAEALDNNGTIMNTEPAPENGYFMTWDHVTYTFDKNNNPISAISYAADGTITGSAIFEWTTIPRSKGGAK